MSSKKKYKRKFIARPNNVRSMVIIIITIVKYTIVIIHNYTYTYTKTLHHMFE